MEFFGNNLLNVDEIQHVVLTTAAAQDRNTYRVHQKHSPLTFDIRLSAEEFADLAVELGVSVEDEADGPHNNIEYDEDTHHFVTAE